MHSIVIAVYLQTTPLQPRGDIVMLVYADATLSGVASEHGPVSFRTECLIPWTVGNHPASSLDSNYL